MQQADQFMQRQITESDSFIRLIKGRALNLNQTIELIRMQVRTNEEVALMQFYAENRNKIYQSTFDSDLPQINELRLDQKLHVDT